MLDLPTPIPAETPCRSAEIRPFGLAVRYRVWGDPARPTVLLQHGGRDHGRSWDYIVNALVDEYCLVVPDLRGHGDSDRPTGGGYDVLDYVTDMAMIVEALAAAGHAQPIDIVGHSLGGNIALRYAAARPATVRRLCVIEGLGYSRQAYADTVASPAPKRWADAVDARLTAAARGERRMDHPQVAVRRLAGLHPQLSPEMSRHLALHALRQHADGSWAWKHDPALLFSTHRPEAPDEYAAIYAGVTCPVLLAYGGKSWARNPSEDGRLDAFANAQLRTYPEAGHWLHHDSMPTFLADLRDFLRVP